MTRATIYAITAMVGLYLLFRFSPLPDSKLNNDFSTAYLASDGTLLNIRLSESGKLRIPVTLDEVSPEMLRGLLAYEDKWFYAHPGVNPVALIRAALLNLASGRVVSGGSTLTLQLAKLIQPRRRTLGAKALEILRAFQLEARFSKRRILEHYLNTAPMGGNLEGVGAASLMYFGKMPRDLSWGEAALLISLPRSPSLRRPDLRPLKAREGRDRVLRYLAAQGTLPPDKVKDAFAALVPTKRLDNPKRCPHLINRVSGEVQPGFVELTVRPPVQEVAERALKRASGGLKALGVFNGSCLVVDNRTMETAAYVGSPDFDDPHGGQVNGAAILRSPGSALKPFLYALAIENGRITPKDMVYDLPRDWSGYRPANFEKTVSGPLQAGDALAQSLNLPAVWLEATLHATGSGLFDWMGRTGFTGGGRGRLDPGLSVVLGAYPVTAEELARLYAMLARDGMSEPLRFREAEEMFPEEGKRLLTAPSAFLVCDMLSSGTRPDLPASWEFTLRRSKVAFKTGTSFGFRDAWCAAVTPLWTVVIWLGNVGGSGNAALLGAKAAAPAAFEIINVLSAGSDEWFKAPQGVGKRSVCRLTGRPPGPECMETEEDWFVAGVSRTDTCPVHKRVWIRKSDGREACLRCMRGKSVGYESRRWEIWPPEISGFLRTQGKRYQALPPHNPDCPAPPTRPAPRIVSPEQGARYVLTQGLPRDAQRLALSAQASPDVKRLFWFVGEKPLGSVRPDGVIFWAPEPGDRVVSVLDSAGRSSSVTIRVDDLDQEKP